VAEARFAQRHQRTLLDAAAPVSGLRVTHHLARVADRFQIAGERHIGNVGGNVVRRNGLEQAGRKPDYVSIRT
jgi:hypothetical protein